MGVLPEWCPTYSSRKKDPVTGEEVFCICKKPDSGELMVGCDGCDDWFHFSCLKIPQKFNELVFSFFCPYCQCGITGPGASSGNLPKTLWRRKCRLPECYKPCAENSKYCSEDHAVSYMCNLIGRVESKGFDAQDVLRQMLQNSDLEKFQKMGHEGVPTPPEGLAPGLFEGDARLRDLESQADKIRTLTRPEIEQQLKKLEAYVAWVKRVNHLLFTSASEDQDGGSSSKNSRALKRKKKSTKPKSICGYHPELRIVCSAEEFAPQYNESEIELYSVCCKLRCPRHLDWAGIQETSLRFQLETLESSLERLALLQKIREDQLKMQVYKELSKSKQA
ncbi:Spp1p [Lachancea thermotolerans CBS 6340]|uniref:KLTH0D10626p n=1 Tax=Lachancea thermotolerans (strain ATCC 56472 / CBS 6340 / NRRL Y-8284) TaxID=559295 RepID=C5DEX9_LACTC|nr:KLTH0D10626p [Lachancea thermotolerans CBS 6340]CAR22734.1 KLTH0D10626p [Lachancea thermotolerans CBS 6340]